MLWPKMCVKSLYFDCSYILKPDMCPMISCDHLKSYEPTTVYFQLETYVCLRHLNTGGMDYNIRYKLRITFWMLIVNFELLFFSSWSICVLQTTVFFDAEEDDDYYPHYQ